MSVIMSTYDNAAYIEAAIASLIGPDAIANWELIVIDDCSTDGTAAILERLARSDDRISARRNETNQGTDRNRNLAIGDALGQVRHLLDSDDEREPTSLEQQVGFLEANPEVVAGRHRLPVVRREPRNRLNDRLYPLTDRRDPEARSCVTRPSACRA